MLLDVYLGYEGENGNIFAQDRDWSENFGKISEVNPDVYPYTGTTAVYFHDTGKNIPCVYQLPLVFTGDWSENFGKISEVNPDISAVKALRKENPDCFIGPNVIKICAQSDIVFLALHGQNGEVSFSFPHSSLSR